MLVHIDPPQKFAKRFKRGVAPRGRGTGEYTLTFFKLGPPKFAWLFTLTPPKKWQKN